MRKKIGFNRRLFFFAGTETQGIKTYEKFSKNPVTSHSRECVIPIPHATTNKIQIIYLL